MSDSTRSRILEVMANAISDAIDIEGWRRPRAAADAALTAYESHLEAEGMAVVSVEAAKGGVANFADIALQDAMEEIEDNGHKIHVYRDDLFLKSMEGNGFRIFSASPYGKASMQEASAERAARSEQIPPGKEESK